MSNLQKVSTIKIPDASRKCKPERRAPRPARLRPQNWVRFFKSSIARYLLPRRHVATSRTAFANMAGRCSQHNMFRHSPFRQIGFVFTISLTAAAPVRRHLATSHAWARAVLRAKLVPLRVLFPLQPEQNWFHKLENVRNRRCTQINADKHSQETPGLRSSAFIGGYSLSLSPSVLYHGIFGAERAGKVGSLLCGLGSVGYGLGSLGFAWVRFGFAFSGGLDLTAPASASADFFA